MAANFPSSPTIGDKYTVGEYQYVWNGSTWSLLPERINEIVNTVTTTANSAVVDLSKGNYHKISSPIDYSNLNITFTNIPSGSSKWFLELNTELGTRSWDISTATYDNVSFSVSGQDTNPLGITFKPDGTKMYMVGATNDRVYQYTLSTPWVVSSATYDSVSFLVSGQDTSPFGIVFKPDGTKMYILGFTNGRVYQYTLSTPWNLATASYDNVSFLVSGQDTSPYSITFKPDGTKMYMVGATNDRVYQYTLSTPWNLATASYDNVSFLVSGQDTTPFGLDFKSDGTKMYMVGFTNGRVYQYTLSTPWNLATASYDNVSFLVSGQDTSPYSITFKPDGTKMYMVGATNDRVYQYSTVDTVSSSLWPSNVIWNYNVSPMLYNGQTLLLEFYTNDGGTTIYGVERYNKEKTE